MTSALIAILAPLAAAASILLLRRRAATIALAGAVASALGAVATLATARAAPRGTIFFGGLPDLPLRLTMSPWAATLSTMVAIVALCVFVYAIGYLDRSEDRPRLFAELSFFAAAMQALVLSGDWILLLATWELIGLASWLLIGFENRDPAATVAADRAFLMTRTADLGLYLAVFVLLAGRAESTLLPATAGVLLLFAAMGKSAQLPFQGWLQGAMRAPTPVSALLHSATLVAAGAILMIRAFPLLPPRVLLAVGLSGGITAVATSAMALAQRDLKRLLAASTSSQLGLMFLALGAGSRGAAAMHLVAHAAMKGALFLAAGAFQRSRGGTDFASLAGVGRDRPRILVGFAVAGFALAGVPPLAGFFSKDAIVASAFAAAHAPVLASLGLAGTLLTAAYVARALRLLWRGQGSSRNPPGLRSMGAGVAALSSLAAALGIVLFPLARNSGFDVPPLEFGVPLISGLAAVAVGLIAGWGLPGEAVPAALRGWIEAGFPVAGGIQRTVVVPVVALARWLGRFDAALLDAVLFAGHQALVTAGAAGAAERVLDRGIAGLGRAALAAGRATRAADEHGLDQANSAIGALIVAIGGRVRSWQSGFVFRELAVAAAGALALLLALAGVVLAGG